MGAWPLSLASATFSAAVVVAALLPPLCAVARAPARAATPGGSGCTTHCGNISIPYPFGVEPGCYHESGFNLTCNQSYSPPQLFLGDGTVQVLDIDLPNATVRINGNSLDIPYGDIGNISRRTWRAGGLGYAADGPYFVAGAGRNNLVALGCNVQVILLGENDTLVSSCSPFCPDGNNKDDTDTCSGIVCCQATILEGRASYGLQVQQVGFGSYRYYSAGVLIVESDYFFHSTDNSYEYTAPAMLTWAINSSICDTRGLSPACRSNHSFCLNYTTDFDQGPENGDPVDQRHNCRCGRGFQGNPYISHGCYDIDECDYPDIYPCYGNCRNTHGGYDCQCPPGFKGNASKPNGCEDIDECDYPDIYPCYGNCRNTHGGYDCQCPPGFKGNASKPNGCEDIDECKHKETYPCYGICINLPGTFHCRCQDGAYGDPFMKLGCVSVRTKRPFTGLGIGLVASGSSIILLLVLAAPFIARKMKLNRANRLKRRLFKQNHGLLLQQLISQKTDFGERMIIPLLDLEKATNNFDRTREAGGGGHGVVYKGILDLQVVAIKKSKIVVQREIDDFINEVAILSQINHRNVVKLIGCCLETEVPLLVYEFISNGTLDYHLHVEGPMSLSWDDRTRIALEVARALSYLHSAASMPIYHRDIKSSNILLDDNLTAKVSDFGASRYIPIDQTGVTTAVQGTIGYLDPMYYYTGRLTDKSDVFSFGVLLVEFLTRKKPCLYRSGGNDGVGLVSHFVSLLAEGNLDEIIDPQLIEEENGEVQEVATLAAMCIKLKGEERPTMSEAEMKLEILRVNMRVALDTAASRRYDRGQTEFLYMPTEAVVVEASRQYTMEEEILSSASYPR
ncbi:unnamed protein product [Triticum turgidum subsp. durum]|uniref:Protein kinase domain-containing protein n=1 Tax=Triticum turgidum subsp. durum TaxID=4567 RepID=A0A9R1BF21_TRITD|nr:unnamed protein product [Triticum turgidum subsp. durum]